MAGENSSPTIKIRGPPLPIRWYLALPVQEEQLLATKLHEAVMVGGRASIHILGLGRVKVSRSQRGSAKKAGASGSEKLTRTTAHEVSSDPQFRDQSFAMGSVGLGAILLLSVLSRAQAEGVRLKLVRSTALSRASWMETWGAPP